MMFTIFIAFFRVPFDILLGFYDAQIYRDIDRRISVFLVLVLIGLWSWYISD